MSLITHSKNLRLSIISIFKFSTLKSLWILSLLLVFVVGVSKAEDYNDRISGVANDKIQKLY